MRRYVFTWLLLCAGLAVAATSRAETYFGFRTGVSLAPPAPVVLLSRYPHFEIVPGTRIHILREASTDADLFRCGDFWYAYSRGYWYRGNKLRGPFQVVEVRSVPRPVLFVPMRYWRHHPDRETQMPMAIALGLASAASQPR